MYPYAANHHIICLHTHIKLKTFCYISIIMTFLSGKVFKGRRTLYIFTYKFIDTLKSIQGAQLIGAGGMDRLEERE